MALRDIEVGMHLRTENGEATIVRSIIKQVSDEAPWVIPKGICGSIGYYRESGARHPM